MSPACKRRALRCALAVVALAALGLWVAWEVAPLWPEHPGWDAAVWAGTHYTVRGRRLWAPEPAAEVDTLRTRRVLVYQPYPEMGLNNQRMLLLKAARLAAAVDRTLVVPRWYSPAPRKPRQPVEWQVGLVSESVWLAASAVDLEVPAETLVDWARLAATLRAAWGLQIITPEGYAAQSDVPLWGRRHLAVEQTRGLNLSTFVARWQHSPRPLLALSVNAVWDARVEEALLVPLPASAWLQRQAALEPRAALVVHMRVEHDWTDEYCGRKERERPGMTYCVAPGEIVSRVQQSAWLTALPVRVVVGEQVDERDALVRLWRENGRAANFTRHDAALPLLVRAAVDFETSVTAAGFVGHAQSTFTRRVVQARASRGLPSRCYDLAPSLSECVW